MVALFLKSIHLSQDRVLLVKNAYRGLASLAKVSGEHGDQLGCRWEAGANSASTVFQWPTNQRQKPSQNRRTIVPHPEVAQGPHTLDTVFAEDCCDHLSLSTHTF